MKYQKRIITSAFVVLPALIAWGVRKFLKAKEDGNSDVLPHLPQSESEFDAQRENITPIQASENSNDAETTHIEESEVTALSTLYSSDKGDKSDTMPLNSESSKNDKGPSRAARRGHSTKNDRPYTSNGSMVSGGHHS